MTRQLLRGDTGPRSRIYRDRHGITIWAREIEGHLYLFNGNGGQLAVTRDPDQHARQTHLFTKET